VRSIFFCVVMLVACEVRERPAVRYLSVTTRAAPTAFGYELSVTTELEVIGRMPHVAPHVKVDAACGNQTDTENAFFMDLSDAQVGDRKVSTAKLFGMRELPDAPGQCEFTLSLTEGATGPERFCYQNGATTPGKCK